MAKPVKLAGVTPIFDSFRVTTRVQQTSTGQKQVREFYGWKGVYLFVMTKLELFG